MKRILLAAATAPMLVPSLGAAGTTSYLCQISEYKTIDGEPDPFAEDAMKTPLAIDRRNGAVVHPWLGNSAFNRSILVNRGSREDSFSSFAYGLTPHGRGIFVEVQEYKEKLKKPFAISAYGTIYFGTCE